jgi:hypothetical protein
MRRNPGEPMERLEGKREGISWDPVNEFHKTWIGELDKDVPISGKIRIGKMAK